MYDYDGLRGYELWVMGSFSFLVCLISRALGRWVPVFLLPVYIPFLLYSISNFRIQSYSITSIAIS